MFLNAFRVHMYVYAHLYNNVYMCENNVVEDIFGYIMYVYKYRCR